MKVSPLNSAIRKCSGPVNVILPTPFGPMTVGIVKSTLLDAIKELHGGVRSTETGLRVDDAGFLVPEGGFARAPVAAERGLLVDGGIDNLGDDDTVGDGQETFGAELDDDDGLGDELIDGKDATPAADDIDDLLG